MNSTLLNIGWFNIGNIICLFAQLHIYLLFDDQGRVFGQRMIFLHENGLYKFFGYLLILPFKVF